MSEQQADYKAETDEALEMLGKGYEPMPPKEFVSTLSGFTLAPDVLINKYGYVTALVWGVVWRFCQMPDGVCRASLEKIGERLGMSERTIIRHMETLCSDGYFLDKTPNLRNKPHAYADTGKIKIGMNFGMTESQRGMTESQRQGDRESVEDTIKKPVKKQKIKEAATPKPPTPEEVKLFREVKGRYPSKDVYEIVVAKVQAMGKRLLRPVTKDDLKPYWLEWRSKGYNPENLAWLDWAVSGVIPQNGKVANIQEPRGISAVAQWMQSKGVSNGD